MEYELQQQITTISSFLNQVAGDPNVRRNTEISDEEVLWDCARFLANALHIAVIRPGAQTEAGFAGFKGAYEQANGIVVDEHGLFERFWLRKSFGYLHIAGAVSYACVTFEKIRPYRKELQFLSESQAGDGQNNMDSLKYGKEEFEETVLLYEQRHGTSLDRQGVYFQSWCQQKEDKVSFSNIEAHFQQYLDHWEDFEFLCAYKKKLQTVDESFLLIGQDKLEQLHASFTMLYPGMPSLQELVDYQAFRVGAGGYTVNFYGGYWNSLGDRISGYSWTLAFLDGTRADKQDALREWLYKTRLLDCHDALGVCTWAARSNFCDEAYLLLKNEADLDGGQDDVKKMLIDSSRSRGNSDLSRFSHPLELHGQDAFEIYKELTSDALDNLDYLYTQRSRHCLIKLIKTFVLNEQEQVPAYGPDGGLLDAAYFHRVRELMRSGKEKPYLLWKIANVITRDRQEVLPHLFKDPELAALGFVLGDEMPFKQDQLEHNAELWQKVTGLFADCATKLAFSRAVTAKVIFRAFVQLNMDKYRVAYQPQRRRAMVTFEIKDIRDQREQNILESLSDAKLHGKAAEGAASFLLPGLFDELSSQFIAYQEQAPRWHGSIQFPMAKWDGICWLMKVATYHKFKQQFEQQPPDIRKLADVFLKSYLALLEIEETAVFDFQSRQEKQGLPSWSERIERLDKLDWLYPVYNLYLFGMLDQFLSPRINIEVADDIYHEKNRLRVMQLRTHVGVLLQVLKKLVLPVIPYGFEKKELDQIRLRLEGTLIAYIKQHSTDEPGAAKVDLFEFNREESLFGNAKEALLPQLARAINWFTDKQAIIEAIQENGDLRKLLTLGEWVTSQGIRRKLLEQAGESDVLALLEKRGWIPEIQSLLLKISQYPELIEKIEEALVVYEIRIADAMQDDTYRRVAYRIRLLLAYFRKDEEQLHKEVPTHQHQVNDRSDLNDLEYKDFYLALIRLDGKPESAYQIFDRLCRRYPAFPSLALNRLVAAYNWADETKTSAGYADALAEWQEAAKLFQPDTLREMEPNLSTILLNIYSRLNDYDRLDKLFSEIDLPYQMLPDVLTIWVDSLVVRERKAEAFYWIDRAQHFHEFADLADIQFTSDLKLKVSGADNIDELIIQYGRIFNSAPEKLIRILPERLNGKTDIGEFLTQEFVYAGDKMLEKIKSIDEIKDENKYNDLMEVILESRVNGFGWVIGGQKRGGFSGAQGPQPGERDLPVVAADGKIIMTAEALIYRGAVNAVPHLIKMFNYCHQRERMLILFYDTGEQGDDFEANWESYRTDVFPKCKFAKGHRPVGPFRDVSADYKVQNSAIKVGKSVLKSGGVIYHVFVQINYNLVVT